MKLFILQAVLVFCCISLPVKAGQFQWTSASWGTSTSGQASPPDTSLTINMSGLNTDQLSGSVAVGANNPPGPGGPNITGRLEFFRSFQITGTPNEIVTLNWTVALNGSVVNPGIGTSGGMIGYRINTGNNPPFTFDDYFQNLGSGSVNFATTYSRNYSTGPTGTATFTTSNYIEANAFALSGPGGSANISVTFGLVPEPAYLLPLAGLMFLGWRRINSA